MTKRQASNWGKRLFILGLLVFAIGSPGGWLLLWVNINIVVENMFIIPGVGVALILLSFAFLAYGSRIGDNQN